jgi:putative ABC transport system substrate-binding protein
MFAFAPLAIGAASRVLGQQAGTLRLGLISAISPSDRDAAFVQALRELGYVEGKNLVIQRHYLQGRTEKLAAAAADLVDQKVDVIFAPQTVAAMAAKRATSRIPVVFAAAPDPVGSGLVASLARPGGNLTGTSSIATELNAKRLQLLREAFPKVSRVVVIRSTEPVVAIHVEEIQRAARASAIETLLLEIERRDQVESRIQQIRNWRADAIYVVQSSTNFNNRELLVELSLKAGLPAIFPYSESVEAGGLMSYGTDFDDLYRRAAGHVARILKGAKPAELPVEQPTKFELVVNLATAAALRVAIPTAILVQADRVIR